MQPSGREHLAQIRIWKVDATKIDEVYFKSREKWFEMASGVLQRKVAFSRTVLVCGFFALPLFAGTPCIHLALRKSLTINAGIGGENHRLVTSHSHFRMNMSCINIPHQSGIECVLFHQRLRGVSQVGRAFDQKSFGGNNNLSNLSVALHFPVSSFVGDRCQEPNRRKRVLGVRPDR